MFLNKITSVLTPTIIAIGLTACGGGSGSSDSNSSNTTTPTPNTVANSLPRELTESNWQQARIISTTTTTETNLEIVGTQMLINIKSDDLTRGDHVQIYLNTDNKAETGFQFEGEAWSNSGVDYLIEDGQLFKSTANDVHWKWNTNAGQIDYAVSFDSVSIGIDLSLLGDICNNLNVGIMTRDDQWDIATFYPASARMKNYTVSYCNTVAPDTKKPILTLLGSNPLELSINDTITDPGALSVDNIDGDISASIITESNVNTAVAGNYTISYTSTDTAGNSSKLIRDVIVKTQIPTGITVDGNVSDWTDIATFSSSDDAIMKVSDDEEKLYILVNSSNLGENVQILMDTDRSTSTGLNLAAQIAGWVAGADYMIENNSLDKSNNNGALWSWDYGIAPIEYIKTADALEVAIKKSDFNFLNNTILMGFVSRSDEWNVHYTLPIQNLPVYTLKFPTVVNPVRANNDNATTTNDKAIDIDVLSNDTSANNTLTLESFSEPSNGSAVIINNKIRYTPTLGFTGNANLSYEIKDNNGNKDTATVNIIVTEPLPPANTAPIANNDAKTLEQGQSTTVDVLANDTDADNDPLTITNITNSNNGTATISNNRINYSPKVGFSGIDTYTYTIDDAKGGIATATITFTVTIPAPIANADSISAVGSQAVTFNVLSNDSDTSNPPLTVTTNTVPTNGTLNTVSNGVYRYQANAGFTGTDTFTYTIKNNGIKTATATVTITVTAPPVNNAPDAVEDVAGVFFNQTITINVLQNDTDPDNDILSVESIQPATQGVATLNADGTIFFDPQGNVGSISIPYTVSDGRGGTDIAVLTVSSTDPNDGNDAFPDISNEFVSTPKNTPITVNVLANDSDADGDALILDQVDQGENGATVKVSNGIVTYTPNPDFTGTDIFYYGVHDGFGHNGSGFVRVTVTP